MSKTAWLIAGGGLKGAFDLPILQHHLATDGLPDYIFGVSIGAINGAAVACGKLDTLVEFYESIDSRSAFGIPGVMTPALLRSRGLYSLKPIERMLKKHIHAQDLKCSLGAGFVSRLTGDYHQPIHTNESTDKSLHRSILASSAIAGIHEPYTVPIAGQDHVCSDGGHVHVLPRIPWDVTNVVAIFHKGLDIEDRDTCEVDGLFESFEWMMSVQFSQQVLKDYDFLKKWGAHPANRALVYAPHRSLGKMFDASSETIKDRIKAGERALLNPLRL